MEPADSKLPFIRLVASASHALIGQPVCLQVGDRITLSETAAKLVSVLAAAEWTPSRFASCLGFPSARITKVSSETREEDTVKQMEGVLLAWAESMGKTATVEMALKSIYEADELDILDSILNELTVSGDTEKRNVPGYPRKLSSPQTKAQQPHFTAKSEGKPSVPVPPNLDPPPYEGQCELASEPPPLSPVGSESRCPFPAAIADSNYEAQTPIAESQPSSSDATPHTVTGTFTTTTQNSTGQERKDHQIERMLSELESLSQKMKAMEEELEEVEADRQKECLLFEKISEDWSSRINTLQKDNQRLCTEVRDLQNELNRTKQELHKALAEVDGLKIKAARLEKENAELRESTSLHNEQERMEKERLERENAELQQEVCKLKTLQEKYEKEIGEMKEKMKVTTRELEQCMEMGMPNKSPEQSEGVLELACTRC